MLESLGQAGTGFRHELSHAWESLSEGSRELLYRGGNALTHFSRNNNKEFPHPASGALVSFPRCSLLAGEVDETGKEIAVRVEVPGMYRKGCRITIEGNMLFLSGEKHFECETGDSTCHVMERAYGAFQRTIPLPRDVETDKVEASYLNGVLRIRLPKAATAHSRDIPVS